MEEIRGRNQRAVVWGAGSKAVSFLNALEITDEIPYVVDINPYKKGRYIPGSGQKIVQPLFLKKLRPEIVILMNPIYRQEIEAQLRKFEVKAELIDA